LAGYRRDVVLLGTVGVFWLTFSLSLLPTAFPRVTYWLPAVVPTAILAAYLAAAIPKRWAIAGGIVVGGCLLWGLAESVQINRVLSRQNTRVLAYDFVAETIPENAPILIGDPFIYSAPLDRNETSMQRMQSVTELPPSYEHFLKFPADAPHPQYDLFGGEYRAVLTSAEEWRGFVTDNEIEFVVEADYCNENESLEATIPD
jgi:hypothetical protein